MSLTITSCGLVYLGTGSGHAEGRMGRGACVRGMGEELLPAARSSNRDDPRRPWRPKALPPVEWGPKSRLRQHSPMPTGVPRGRQRLDMASLDGADLEYEVSGTGEPVVFIHGAFIADTFRPLLAEPSIVRHYQLTRCAGFSGPGPRAPLPSKVTKPQDGRARTRGPGHLHCNHLLPHRRSPRRSARRSEVALTWS